MSVTPGGDGLERTTSSDVDPDSRVEADPDAAVEADADAGGFDADYGPANSDPGD